MALHILQPGDLASGRVFVVNAVPPIPILANTPIWLGTLFLDEGFVVDPATKEGDAVVLGFFSLNEVFVDDEVIFDMKAAPFGVRPENVEPVGQDFAVLARRVTGFSERRGLSDLSAALRELANGL